MGKRRRAVAVIKRPLVLKKHKSVPMRRDSGLVIYWLALLAVIVLGMLASIVIGGMQLVSPDGRILVVVLVFGLLFGFVTHRLLGLIECLEPRHRFFARIFVPAALALNLFIVSSAASSLASWLGLFSHNPLLVGLTFGAGLVLPSVVSAANHNLYK